MTRRSYACRRHYFTLARTHWNNKLFIIVFSPALLVIICSCHCLVRNKTIKNDDKQLCCSSSFFMFAKQEKKMTTTQQ
jgi:hypothetical protein